MFSTENLVHDIPGYFIINNDLEITATNEILVNGVWKYPGEIRIGDKLMNSDKGEEEVESIYYVEKEVIVYNLEIEGTSTYFASGVMCLIFG